MRHGLTDANTGGTLAGWTPGVHLADKGRDQVAALSARLAKIPLTAIVSSPLERCQETAQALLGDREGLTIETDDRLGECRYGDWQGQPLKTLAKDPLWKVVQAHPSAVTFPGGEALRDTQARAVDAVRHHNARLGPDATWVAVSHGDVIKAILADALGLHLDAFQRIVVDPASVSIVTYTDLRPFVVRTNDIGGDLAGLIPRPRKRRKRSSDAAVGGGAGGAG
ncbi:MAG TPA: histidine phosphatase family protein [Mycobacteriales bacterium]|nr:histidine phosphatase family protein [Mycobacteriales bacterium]